MLKRRLLFICFAAALCLSAAPAFADMYGTLGVDYNGLITGYSQLNLTRDDGTNWNMEYSVGLHSLTLGALDTTGAPDALPGDSYLVQGLVQAFCVDLIQGFPIVTQTYNAVSLDVPPVPGPGSPMGDTKAKYIAQLLNTNSYATVLDAAAMQAAIWEVIYESTSSTWSLTAGGTQNFYLDTAGDIYGEAAVAAAANSMFTGLTQASSYSQYTALSEDNKTSQDFVIVPVPAAVILGILGLGVVGIKLRKYA